MPTNIPAYPKDTAPMSTDASAGNIHDSLFQCAFDLRFVSFADNGAATDVTPSCSLILRAQREAAAAADNNDNTNGHCAGDDQGAAKKCKTSADESSSSKKPTWNYLMQPPSKAKEAPAAPSAVPSPSVQPSLSAKNAHFDWLVNEGGLETITMTTTAAGEDIPASLEYDNEEEAEFMRIVKLLP